MIFPLFNYCCCCC